MVISVDLDPSVLLLAFVPHIFCDETVQFLHGKHGKLSINLQMTMFFSNFAWWGGKKALLDAFLWHPLTGFANQKTVDLLLHYNHILFSIKLSRIPFSSLLFESCCDPSPLFSAFNQFMWLPLKSLFILNTLWLQRLSRNFLSVPSVQGDSTACVHDWVSWI